MKEIEELKSLLVDKLTQIGSIEDIKNLKVEFLGKKGKITQLLKIVGTLPVEEKPLAGKLINELKKFSTSEIDKKEKEIYSLEKIKKAEKEKVDVTLPGRKPEIGSYHPVAIVMKELIDIFVEIGFQVAEGPNIEDDYHNFQALNLPPEHPARDMQDTFYISEQKYLLRTHTSPVQIRTMENRNPPIHIIAPGTVYRRDADITHSPMFHQIEGLLVDKESSFSDLKGILSIFARKTFGKDTKVRFRPSFFPFTEPSAEMDIQCVICHGEGCRVCKQTGWLEILGAGMVDPEVLKAVDLNPSEYKGFAFGLGVERIAMLKYGLDDIRLLFENNLRVLSQFK